MNDPIKEMNYRITSAENLIRILKEEGSRTQILEKAVKNWRLELLALEAIEESELQLWEA